MIQDQQLAPSVIVRAGVVLWELSKGVSASYSHETCIFWHVQVSTEPTKVVSSRKSALHFEPLKAPFRQQV
jgi:hypothetical protein